VFWSALSVFWLVRLMPILIAVIFAIRSAEVLPVSGTGESLILSHRKDLEDGSEESSIEVEGDASALHG
jgi:hypothetical protein